MTVAQCLVRRGSMVKRFYAGTSRYLLSVVGENQPSGLNGRHETTRTFSSRPNPEHPGTLSPTETVKGVTKRSGWRRSTLLALALGSFSGAGAFYWWYSEEARWGPGPAIPKEQLNEGGEKEEASESSTELRMDESVQFVEGKAASPQLEKENESQHLSSVRGGADTKDTQKEEAPGDVEGQRYESSENEEAAANEAGVTEEQEVNKATNTEKSEEVVSDEAGEQPQAEESKLEGEYGAVESVVEAEGEPHEVKIEEREETEHTGEEAVAAMAADLAEDAAKLLEKEVEASIPEDTKIEANVEVPELDSRFQEASDSLAPSSLIVLSHEEAEESDKSVNEQVQEAVPALLERAELGGEEQAYSLVYRLLQAAVKKQSQVDNDAFLRALEDLKETHSEELKGALSEAERQARLASQLESNLERVKFEFREAFMEQKQRMEESKEKELKQKVKEAEEELEEALLMAEAELEAKIAAQKGQSLQNLAEIELQLKGLREAFFHKSEESRKSHRAHKIALCAFSLEEAVSEGLPLGRNLEALRESAAQDPLIEVVLEALPSEVAQKGVPTRPQLLALLDSIESDLRTLALLPGEGGGVLAHGLAKLVSYLKISEEGTELPGGGVEASLSRARKLLSEGHVLEAAEAVRRGVAGSRAEGLAEVWATEARNRAVVEQTLAVVHAHATTLAASLS